MSEKRTSWGVPPPYPEKRVKFETDTHGSKMERPTGKNIEVDPSPKTVGKIKIKMKNVCKSFENMVIEGGTTPPPLLQVTTLKNYQLALKLAKWTDLQNQV